MLNFLINMLFYNDNTVHDIYEQAGYYDFIYLLPQIIYSTIITTVVTTIF